MEKRPYAGVVNRDTAKARAFQQRRRKPLPRGAGPARTGTLPRGGPLRQRSDKTAAFYRDERVPFVRDLMARVTWCQAPVAYRLALVDDPLPHCSGPLDPHERRRRSQLGSLVNPENVMVICRGHHDVATVAGHDSAEHKARIVTFEGDDGWDRLGR